MPIMYKPDPLGLNTGPESLTEREHKDSCNINIMLKRAMNGQPIRTSNSPQIYNNGESLDDTNLTALQHRINRAELEESLQELGPQAELTEEQLKSIPEKDRQRFGFKLKDAKLTIEPEPIAKNLNDDDDDSNDDDEQKPISKKLSKKS